MLGAAVLGRYRVVARLGQGGMGVVYLARAEGAAGFAKPVVVKRVLADLTGNAQTARLFVREAKILANLQHPNIVGVIDFGEEAGAYMMVLEYVRAYDLGRWLDWRRERGERLPVECVIHIVIKVLDALDYAHSLKGPDDTALEVIHSDVSPGNVLVDTEGHVKLLDFGIARMKGSSTQATDSKSIRGKFAYLPVEALDGSPPTRATDVYASAVTLYELLVGENPFIGVDETRTVAKVISTEPAPASSLRPDVPPELDAILARGMAKDPTKRFASAKEFARELRKVQKAPEDEVATLLGSLAKNDYAAMPAKPGTSISDLESSWRNPPATPVTMPDASTSDLAFRATEFDSSRKKGRGVLFAIAGAITLLAASGIVLAVVLTRRADAEAPKVILVEKNDQPSATPTPSTTESPSTSPSPSPAVSSGAHAGTTTTATPTKPTAPAGDPLSAAFAKNQSQIEGCFRDHAANAAEGVRITIDKDGTVQRAEMVPADVSSSPLGACILGIAKQTKFPPQTAPSTTFRIPLKARKVN